MNNPYPRVLLVNVQPISRRYATGIAMGNLFRGWPLDRIAQVYCDDSEPDETVCPRSWRLDALEDRPMTQWLRRQAAGRWSVHEVTPVGVVHGGAEQPHSEPRLRGWAAGAAKTAFLRYSNYAPYAIPDALNRAVAAFRPDVIYSYLEDRRITAVAHDFARRLSLPLIPHFMDDWMTTAAAPRSGILKHWARRDLERKALRVLHDAPVRLVIGEYMADAYQRRYGLQFLPFSTCVDLEERPVIRTNAESRAVFRFGFTGGLLFGRVDRLADVVAAFEALNADGTRMELVVYQHEPGEALLDRILRSPVARLADAREETLLETADCQVDAFLHVDTFEQTAGTYLQFSMSAKVPWYLAAGVPLFAYGAPELGTMRFLREHECAAIVGRRDQQLLRDRVRDFVGDNIVRQALGARARLVAQEYFDARVQREAFRRVLAQPCRERYVCGSPMENLSSESPGTT